MSPYDRDEVPERWWTVVLRRVLQGAALCVIAVAALAMFSALGLQPAPAPTPDPTGSPAAEDES